MFLVSYDLVHPGRDYPTLYEVLRGLDGAQVLESVWVCFFSGSAADLLEHLRSVVDTNDRLLVVDISNSAIPISAYRPMIEIDLIR